MLLYDYKERGVIMGLLNDRIKSMRISRGYTLSYVAEQLGIKEATMQRYESGEIKNIKHETIANLAEILNCSPVYLMGWENDNTSNTLTKKVFSVGEKFNENLKMAREQKNLTQKEVADSIGVAKSTYSLYESGEREPNVQTIKKIADTLNVSAVELLGLNSEPTTIAAHKDGENFTPEELDKIEEYKRLLLAARPKNNGDD